MFYNLGLCSQLSSIDEWEYFTSYEFDSQKSTLFRETNKGMYLPRGYCSCACFLVQFLVTPVHVLSLQFPGNVIVVAEPYNRNGGERWTLMSMRIAKH